MIFQNIEDKLRGDWLEFLVKSFTASLIKNNPILSQRYVSLMVDASTTPASVVPGANLTATDTITYEVILTPRSGLHIGNSPAYVVRNNVNMTSQALTTEQFKEMFFPDKPQTDKTGDQNDH